MTIATKSDPRWLDVFLRNLQAAGLPEPVREFRFAPPRRWRVDLWWEKELSFQVRTGDGVHMLYMDAPVAIEVEGGAYVQGRHTQGLGHERDMEKYNEMTLRGIRLLRFSPRQMQTSLPLDALRRML